MKGEFTNTLKVAFIYVTAIIGAGFASGQEIVQFFSVYYRVGFYGIILAGIMFSIIGCIVLNKVYTERIRNYDEFLFPVVGYYPGIIMETVVTLFMFTLFSVMTAGTINILTSKAGIPFVISALLMAFAYSVFMIKGIKAIASLSMFVTPVLIAGMLMAGFYIIAYQDTYVFNAIGLNRILTRNWLSSSILYVSYNSILSIAVLCELQPYLKTRRIALAGGCIGGCLLCIIAVVINAALSVVNPDFLKNELPVLDIIGKNNDVFNFIYMLILWIAMFTSGIMAGYGFAKRVNSCFGINMKFITVISCAAAVVLSGFGFSNLISVLYPLFGYAGLFMIIVVLVQGVRDLFIGRHKRTIL